MGLNTFNAQNSLNISQGFPLYRPKMLPLTNLKYGGVYVESSIPVVRSAVDNKVFQSTATTGIDLLSFSTLGAQSTVASITFNTYLSGGLGTCTHLNSADTCLYLLLRYSSNLALIKINDTTGVVTAIGSSFTPTNVSNWPTASNYGTLNLDTSTGHLRVSCNGFYHLLNKTTGAIVSQDNVITLGTYLAQGVSYTSLDGTIGMSYLGSSYSGNDGIGTTPSLVSAAYGFCPLKIIPVSAQPLQKPLGTDLILHRLLHLIDNDKVMLGYVYGGSGSLTAPTSLYSRIEFDKYLKSVVDFSTGTYQ